MKIREYFDYLTKVEVKVSEFHNKEITLQSRKELTKCLHDLVENGMYRKDEQGVIRVWVDKDHHDLRMVEDIRIINDNNKFYVSTDILWKTLTGLHEQINES